MVTRKQSRCAFEGIMVSLKRFGMIRWLLVPMNQWEERKLVDSWREETWRNCDGRGGLVECEPLDGR